MDDLLEYNIYNDNNNENNNNIEDVNNLDDEPCNTDKLSALFVLIIAITLFVMDFLSIYYSYNYLLYASKKYSFDTFDKCIKYQSISELFFILFATLASISAGIMALGIILGHELFFEKFLVTFLNFNYYVFGLLLLSSSLIGLIYYNKVCYDCIDNNPKKQEFNLSTMICLNLILFVGGIISFLSSSMNTFEYVCDCVKLKKDGNYFLGKAFWKYVLMRHNDRQNVHERNE